MQPIKIYDRERQYTNSIRKLKESNMNEKNKQTLLDFFEYAMSIGIGKVRLLRYYFIIKYLDKHLEKDFNDADINDLRKIINVIQFNEKLSPYTKSTYKICIKRFYKYLNGDKDYPEKVKWISARVKKNEKILPCKEDFLTPEDIDKLISVSTHPRDKAFISMIWESGCRASEIGSLRIKDIIFDEMGFTMSINGKTGMRRIRLISSTPYVSTWLDNHPLKGDPTQPLWVWLKYKSKIKHLEHRGMFKILERAFLAAGIKKKHNPHFFRHSRATFMANHLTEFQMNQYFGWVQGSEMPSVYVHMSGKHIDDAIFKMHGLKKDESQKDEFKPKKCPRCNVINNHDTRLCINCAFILNEEEAIKVQQKKEGELKGNELMNKLMEDPDVQKLLAKKIGEMGLFGKLSG
ncbi:MAG: tyrosine-type recombinase/integrase [Candidatus Woesearchaeota archaeon]